MIAAKDKITPGQLMVLVVQTQIGLDILLLPSQVQKIARNDAWISVILAGIATLVLILIIWGLGRRFPTMNVFEYLPLLVGKFAGKIVHVVFALTFILECSQILVQFADIVRDWIFPNTPAWVILTLTLMNSLYMVRENIRSIARFFVLTFGLLFVLILIAAYAYKDANFMYILPVYQAGLPKITEGMMKSMNALLGFEILLFCYPLVQGGSKAILKATIFANIFSTLIYTFMVFTCLVVFSPEELRAIPQPILYLVKALSFTVIERSDLYFLTIWTIVVITTVMAYLYMSSKAVSTLFGKKHHSGTVPFVAIVILCISLYSHDQNMVNMLQNVVGALTSVSLVAVPLILLCISYLLRIKGKGRAEG